MVFRIYIIFEWSMDYLSSVFKIFLHVFQDWVIRFFRPVLLEYKSPVNRIECFQHCRKSKFLNYTETSNRFQRFVNEDISNSSRIGDNFAWIFSNLDDLKTISRISILVSWQQRSLWVYFLYKVPFRCLVKIDRKVLQFTLLISFIRHIVVIIKTDGLRSIWRRIYCEFLLHFFSHVSIGRESKCGWVWILVCF